MTVPLKQSASDTVLVGPAEFPQSSGDGANPVTGLGTSSVDAIEFHKSDGTVVDISGSTTLTHIGNGYYTVTVSATDTDTLGQGQVIIRDDDTTLAVRQVVLVQPANVYDSLVAGSDKLQVDVEEIDGDTASAGSARFLFNGAGTEIYGDLLGGAVTGNGTVQNVANRVDANLTHTNGTATPSTSGEPHVRDSNGNALATAALFGDISSSESLDDWIRAMLRSDGGAASLTGVIDSINKTLALTDGDYSVFDDSQEGIRENHPSSFSTLTIQAGGHVEAVSSTNAELATNSDMQTLLSRITSNLFSGMTSLADWLRTLAKSSNVDTTAQSEINNASGDDYDATADSQEAHSTQLASIKNKTDSLSFTSGNVHSAPQTSVTLTSAERDAVANALLDLSDAIEPASEGTERTVREALRIIVAASGGKLSGAGGTSIDIRDLNDTKNRISATVDSDGNRTAVSYDDT